MSNPKFDLVLQKMKTIHDKKSQDYANDQNRYANFEAAATSAGTSVDVVFRTLIGVKLARLAELQGKGKAPLNESIADSLIDLAVYATLYASYYEKPPFASALQPLTGAAEYDKNLWPNAQRGLPSNPDSSSSREKSYDKTSHPLGAYTND